MWWLKKIRYAKLDPQLREDFNAFGILGMTDCLVNNYPPAVGTGHALGMNDQQIKAAGLEWIREYNDKVERRDSRLESLEWMVFVLVVTQVVLAASQVILVLSRSN